MNQELLRRRRCLALRVAIFFGVLLPIVNRDLVSLVVAVIGIALAVTVYWRNCRAKTGADTTRTGT
jgi:Flp pilus assembly protein TadB